MSPVAKAFTLSLLITFLGYSPSSYALKGKRYHYGEVAPGFNFDIKVSGDRNKRHSASKGGEIARIYRHPYREYVYYVPAKEFEIVKQRRGKPETRKSIKFNPSHSFPRTHKIRLRRTKDLLDAICIANCPTLSEGKSSKPPILIPISKGSTVFSGELFFYSPEGKPKDKAIYHDMNAFYRKKITNGGPMVRKVIKELKPWSPSNDNYISVVFNGTTAKGFIALKIIDHVKGREDIVRKIPIRSGKNLIIKGPLRIKIHGTAHGGSLSYRITDTPKKNGPYYRLQREIGIDADPYLPGLTPSWDYPFASKFD